jgi:hypothetical protein
MRLTEPLYRPRGGRRKPGTLPAGTEETWRFAPVTAAGGAAVPGGVRLQEHDPSRGRSSKTPRDGGNAQATRDAGKRLERGDAGTGGNEALRVDSPRCRSRAPSESSRGRRPRRATAAPESFPAGFAAFVPLEQHLVSVYRKDDLEAFHDRRSHEQRLEPSHEVPRHLTVRIRS